MASKKSKILAMALCASVMTGIYASPVMAAGQISGITLADASTTLVANDQIFINGVELSGDAVKATGGNFTQLTVTNGMEITGGVLTVGATSITSIDSTTGNTVVGGTLTAAGLASLNGGLNVSGGATVHDMLTASDGLTVTNNGIKVEEGGLTVEMGDTVLNDLSAGTTTLDRLTVTDGQAEFKQGAFVEGQLYADQAKVGAAGLEVVGDTTLKSTLKVDGQTTLNGLTAGATTVDSLKSNGNAEVGGTLTAGSGNFTVDTDGNTTIIGANKQLTVEGTAQIGTMTATTAQVGGGLTVAGETTLVGLTANGAANLKGGLNVTGGAKADSLEVTGDTTLNGLTATGAANLNGGLNVTGGAKADSLEVTGDTTLNGLTATGAANLNGGLKVTGGTETDELKVTGVATVDSLKVTNNAEIGGNANVKGELYAANNKFSVDENANIFTAGGLTVKEGAMIGGGLSVTDGLAVTGGANITGNSLVTGNLGVTGLTTLTGGLTVSGQTTLNNNLHVNGNADIDGNLKVGTVADVEQSILDLEEYAGELKDANLPDKVGGIERDPASAGDPGDGTTTIEGATSFDSNGMSIKDADGFGTSLGVAGMEITAADGLRTTFTAGGATFVGASASDTTTINGGAITAKSLLLDGKNVGETIAGIVRDPENEVTTIEGATSFDATGMSIKDADGFGTSLGVAGMEITAADGLSTSFTAGGATFVGASASDITTINGGAIKTNTINGVEFTKWHDEVNGRLGKLEYKTQNIKPGAGTGTGTGEGGTAAGEGNNIIDVPATEDGHTGINGNVTVGGEINAGTGNIGGVGMEEGTITTGDTTIDG
ncbi:hypothetical protein QUV93_06195, partial [Phascolarctobacterium faecium]